MGFIFIAILWLKKKNLWWMDSYISIVILEYGQVSLTKMKQDPIITLEICLVAFCLLYINMLYKCIFYDS